MWDDVKDALREGVAPEPEEVLAELQTRIKKKRFKATIAT